MYVATRDLVCFGKKVKAGEPIPEPQRWSPVVLQSNLNIGYVKEVPDGKRADPPRPGLPKKRKPKVKQETVLQCCGRTFKTKGALASHSRSHK